MVSKLILSICTGGVTDFHHETNVKALINWNHVTQLRPLLKRSGNCNCNHCNFRCLITSLTFFTFSKSLGIVRIKIMYTQKCVLKIKLANQEPWIICSWDFFHSINHLIPENFLKELFNIYTIIEFFQVSYSCQVGYRDHSVVWK